MLCNKHASFKKHTRYYLCLIIHLFIFSIADAVAGPGDTIVVNSTPTVKRSLVQSMNKEQLNNLIDFLMEMDTIPTDLAKEISIASERFKNIENGVLLPKTLNSTFPSADIYASWEINKLFPEKDLLKFKGDTSICLVLKSDGHSNYFQPFNGPITSNFGWRDSTQHNGVDIDLNKGDKVAAAFDGMVRVAKNFGGFGNVVIIRHYNGLETVYAHLSKIKVKPGQIITAGQMIGLGGSTGHSTGSHLHFEVRFKGVPINPKYLISFSEQKLLCNELVLKKSKWGLAAYPKDQKYYVIERGDTIFEVAKHFGTTTASIKQLNGFNNSRIRLKVGQQINVNQ